MSDSDIILKISNVGVTYADKPAIENVSIEVKRGEFFGVIGVNGAGKTTLIKTILGLRDADAGEIEIMGQKINQNSTSPHVAFLPERFEPSWFLTGLEFLKFSTGLYGVKYTDAEYKKCAEELVLDPDALKRRVHTYSKGMRQKLGLMATIMTKAELLIFDEPMSGLDPSARTHVKDMLIAVKNRGHTIFMNSHILADMDEICDRVCLIHNQQARFIGEPKNLKQQTQTQNLERAFLHYIEQKSAA